MKHKTIEIFLFIDALGWKIVNEHDFLTDMLPYRKKINMQFGYSSSAIPTILSGKTPAEHGHLGLFRMGERMKPGENVVLDLEKLVNIDSYGLDALLAVAQKALENDSSVKLARVSPDMRIVLDITRVYRVFEIYSTIEEAVQIPQK